MKCFNGGAWELVSWSLPVRGAWVEMVGIPADDESDAVSLPVRGAWVEIIFVLLSAETQPGRSPCGERGLKCGDTKMMLTICVSLPVRGAWVEMLAATLGKCNPFVAPRAGSVG